MSNLKSPFLRVVAPWVDAVETVMKMLGVYEFMPSWVLSRLFFVCTDEIAINFRPQKSPQTGTTWWSREANSCARTRRPLKKSAPMCCSCCAASIQTNWIAVWLRRFSRILQRDLRLINSYIMLRASILRNSECSIMDWQRTCLSMDHSHRPTTISKQSQRRFIFITVSDFNHSWGCSFNQKRKEERKSWLILPQNTPSLTGDNDWMAAVKDVDELSAKLGNLAGKHRVADPKFNHLDFTYATDVKTLLYDRVIDIIKSLSWMLTSRSCQEVHMRKILWKKDKRGKNKSRQSEKLIHSAFFCRVREKIIQEWWKYVGTALKGRDWVEVVCINWNGFSVSLFLCYFLLYTLALQFRFE